MSSSDEGDEQGFEARLLPALLEVVAEQRGPGDPGRGTAPQPRRPLLRRPGVIATVAGTAALVAIAFPAITTDPLPGALAIARHKDTLYLRVDDALADPRAMTQELRAAGLDAKVEVVPVSPSFVGKWVDVVNDSTTGHNDPRIVDLFRQMYPEEDEGTKEAGTPRALVLKVPADFSTPITLRVGRAAQDDERWLMSHTGDVPDERRLGGILHCLQDLDLREVDGILQELGYEVDWRYSPSPSHGESVPEPPEGKVIAYGELLGPQILLVETVDPDSGRAPKGPDGGGC